MQTQPDNKMSETIVHSGNTLLETPNGIVKNVDLDEMGEADRALAADFGYRPVFKREFGYLATFSFAVSIGGLFASISTTFIYPLQAGGSASVVWCWLISGAGCMCLAVCQPCYFEIVEMRSLHAEMII